MTTREKRPIKAAFLPNDICTLYNMLIGSAITITTQGEKVSADDLGIE